MRLLWVLLFVVSVFLLQGCKSDNNTVQPLSTQDIQSEKSASAPALAASDAPAKSVGESYLYDSDSSPEVLDAQSALSEAATTSIGGRLKQQPNGTVTVEAAAVQQAAAQAMERKIVRNGGLTIESGDPTAGQRQLMSIAESYGGYIVTSEFRQDGKDASKQSVVVTMRIPSKEFDEALVKIRATGRVLTENVTGKDVTEEYLDLEARLKTKRALEEQFLQIMKRAAKVSDALEVQNEITNVRTEIEQMEGRRRFLANQAALSTIAVTLQTPTPIVITATTTGFGHNVKQAFADGIDFTVSMILFLIRLVIMLIPVALFILLPVGLALRFFIRRWRTHQEEEPLPQE